MLFRSAFVALGQTGEAVDSYKKALERERQRPSYRTTAWSEFVLLVADRRLESDFDEALRVLGENQSGLIFPKLMFAWHGAYALIQAQMGHRQGAKEHAVKALEAAQMGHSGFRRHPKIGLVGSEHDGIRKKLRHLARGSLWETLISGK